MLRLAPAGAGFLAAVLLACSAPPAPAPTKVSETQGVPTPSKPIPSPFINPNFINPNKESPPPRSEPQLPPDQLAAAITKADADRKIGSLTEAMLTLHTCANKVPQSVRCEGELAALLAGLPRHKYESEYYLTQAIASDEPGLDADYYRRLGQGLQARGMYEAAATAFTRMIERSQPAATAADHYMLSVVLQGVPSRLADATAALHRAYELDPSQHAWLRDEAILLGQQSDQLAAAIARFEEFKTKTTDADLIADTDRRIAELKHQAEAAASTPPAATKTRKPKQPTG